MKEEFISLIKVPMPLNKIGSPYGFTWSTKWGISDVLLREKNTWVKVVKNSQGSIFMS